MTEILKGRFILEMFKAVIAFFAMCFRFLFVENWPITLVVVLGMVSVAMLLPQPRRRRVLLGTALGVAAVVLGGWLIVRVGALNIETFLFYLFSAVAVIAGGLLVTQENPARAALSFALVIIATCGLFLIQAAPFLMAATIIVYAGAIIVTFLFVIMLAQQQGRSDADARSREPYLSAITGFLLLGALLYLLRVSYKPDLDRWVKRAEGYLAQVRATEGKPPLGVKTEARMVDELSRFLADFERWWKDNSNKHPSSGKPLADALGNATFVLPVDDAPRRLDTTVVTEHLEKVVAAGLEMRNNPLLGNLEPSPAAHPGTTHLSELSGPRSSRPVNQLRVDEYGRPHLPAENTAYVGRSLFGDYLLPVELAGLLLLVATVGAIAIAQRRPAPPAPPRNVMAPR